MKKIILIAVMLIGSYTSFAQTSVFDKFEDMDDVTTVVVNKEAFNMLSSFKGNDPESQEYVKMVQNLKSLKVFTTESAKIATQMKNVVSSYLKTAKLTELMRVKDKDAHVKIYVRKGKDENHVSELLMFVSDLQNKADQQAVILSLTGDIDLNKISELTSTYIPKKGKQHKEQ
ncbi:MAG: DUF4252 domain-containing protein [Lutibacter sp.]|jgi:acyl-CoA-binding protein|uniref:DUF4252 domain-containing protein n=1 Tax=Lutibacter sp. TaxID=1925666 RepID=UPI00299E8B98|nr:DUF4252 domain-containing protein [Lutibacter sp.]MDX1828073.1 DUF4252 domain-containing protein [Lutibacter sp.]